ncbi:MAG: hypothetical protein GKS06_16255 [Acidobacteria bacterium]|nr:hypothetical protein [Acidobacteriota bacterium]
MSSSPVPGMTGSEVRALRGGRTGAVFGQDVREELAGLLAVPVEAIPSVSYTQVSRWEKRGLDPDTGKITTLVYLAALRRMDAAPPRA